MIQDCGPIYFVLDIAFAFLSGIFVAFICQSKCLWNANNDGCLLDLISTEYFVL